MIRCIYKGLKLKQEADEKLERAAWFALHCDEDIEGLDELVLAYEKQEYDRKADFPWIGMTLEEAYDTKLGEPGKVTKDTGSWGHAQHEFGDLTWYLDEETDERLCQAHYYDDKIDRVIDYRNGQVTWYELQWDGGVKVTHYGEDPVEVEVVSEPEAAAEKETAETEKSSGKTKGSGGAGTGSGSLVGR